MATRAVTAKFVSVSHERVREESELAAALQTATPGLSRSDALRAAADHLRHRDASLVTQRHR